jgi:hypothetical protein
MPVATAYTVWWKASIAISRGAQKIAGGAMSKAGQCHLRAPPDGGAVGLGRAAWRQACGAEQAPHHPPAGAVGPVRKVIETRLGDLIFE